MFDKDLRELDELANPVPSAEAVASPFTTSLREMAYYLPACSDTIHQAADTIDRLTAENEKLTRQSLYNDGLVSHWQRHCDRLKDEIAGYPSVADLRMAMVLAADENANQKEQIEKFKDQYTQAVATNEACRREIERLTAALEAATTPTG